MLRRTAVNMPETRHSACFLGLNSYSGLCPPSEDSPVRRSLPPLLACAIILGLCVAAHAADVPAVKLDDKEKAQQGSDIAWMLVATGLVLVMVPGLALFYGGMVRRKNALGTMMHSMIALSIIGIQWLLFGYCLAFGASQSGLIGWKPAILGLNDVLSNQLFPGTHIP